MVAYESVVSELKALSEQKFAEFQRRIINDDKLDILGVRMPVLRKVAKKYSLEDHETFMGFPDEYFEVVFLKLAIAARMPYTHFVCECERLVNLLSDWALCDCFAPDCIGRNRDAFIPFIKKFLAAKDGYAEGEYIRRFAYTTLLHFYVEESYLPLIIDCLNKCKNEKYYVTMAAAWLLSVVLVKHYDVGFEYLNSTMCDINMRNKAISKACDSYRITSEQKEQLKALRKAKKS